ncbi:MAG: FadR/GntR family transcriptional regulator [Candidatus Atribacteria bacterium]|nr:FadR/GntR family transcriptional regulator [Candidatus Atribacteria bacterium]
MPILKNINSDGNPQKRQTAVHEVVTELKDRILNEGLKTGDRLPTELEFAREFGVSRTVIREVVKMLEAVGLVEVHRGRGTFISNHPSFSIVETLTFVIMLQNSSKEQIYDFRKAIEIGMLETVIDNRTESDIEEMQKFIDGQKTLEPVFDEGTGKSKEAALFDLMFHRFFLYATHNPLLVLLAEGVWEALHKSIGRGIPTRKDLERTIRNHENILDAIKRKDKMEAREAIIKALDDWKKHSED